MRDEKAIDGRSLALAALGVLSGTALALLVVPAWAGALERSLLGADPKAVWYVTRASGFVAYGLLWLSVVLGLWLTNRFARVWPSGPVAFELHEWASLLGLGFALVHALVLIGNRHTGGTLVDLFVPFAASRGRVFMGLGQLSLYLLALVTASFYVKKRLGQRAWRLLHFASFALYLMALAHALSGGTEARLPLGRAFFWLTGGSVLFLSVHRALGRALRSTPGSGRRASPRTSSRQPARRGP